MLVVVNIIKLKKKTKEIVKLQLLQQVTAVYAANVNHEEHFSVLKDVQQNSFQK